MTLAAMLERALGTETAHEDEADFGAPEGGYREAAVLVPVLFSEAAPYSDTTRSAAGAAVSNIAGAGYQCQRIVTL